MNEKQIGIPNSLRNSSSLSLDDLSEVNMPVLMDCIYFLRDLEGFFDVRSLRGVNFDNLSSFSRNLKALKDFVAGEDVVTTFKGYRRINGLRDRYTEQFKLLKRRANRRKNLAFDMAEKIRVGETIDLLLDQYEKEYKKSFFRAQTPDDAERFKKLYAIVNTLSDGLNEKPRTKHFASPVYDYASEQTLAAALFLSTGMGEKKKPHICTLSTNFFVPRLIWSFIYYAREFGGDRGFVDSGSITSFGMRTGPERVFLQSYVDFSNLNVSPVSLRSEVVDSLRTQFGSFIYV